jgi:hypothetical protein
MILLGVKNIMVTFKNIIGNMKTILWHFQNFPDKTIGYLALQETKRQDPDALNKEVRTASDALFYSFTWIKETFFNDEGDFWEAFYIDLIERGL